MCGTRTDSNDGSKTAGHGLKSSPALLLLIAAAAILGLRAPNYAAAGELSGQVTVRDHVVRDAVVYVDDIKSPPAGHHAMMNQSHRTFIPHVMAVQLGTHVAFPNNDTVYHNVFSYREGKRFDLGLYPVGSTKTVDFNQPGLVRIFCNIHSNMSAFIWVIENPYFAKTDASGRFRIAGVPPGERGVSVWSERYGTRRLSVRVPRDGTVTLPIRLDAR